MVPLRVSRQDGASTQSLSENCGFELYRLGYRKRSAFLTIPPFVLRCAQLLFVLADKMNLRALLTRDVAACEVQEKQDAANRFQATEVARTDRVWP
jgi:hypothetical protein